MVQAGATCPTGMTAEFTFKWPGTQDGCNCKLASSASLNQYNLTSKIYTGVCDSDKNAAGCGRIASTPAADIDTIPGSNPAASEIVCVQRSTGVSFIKTATKMNEDGTCATGNLCGGTGQAGGLYSMCIDGATCPVMNMVIQSAAYTNATVAYTKVGDLQTGGVYITREGGNLPLAELVSSVDQVCKNDNDQSYYGPSNHPLLRDTSHIQYSCEGGADNTFVEIVRKSSNPNPA